MEILLANVALNAGIIDGKMFVALIFMAIITSLVPGPVLRRILRRHERKTFTTYMTNPDGFIPDMKAMDMEAAIKELCAAANYSGLSEELINNEYANPCGNHDQLAICKAHVHDLSRIKIVLGFSKCGIDFSGQDGLFGEEYLHFSHIIVLVLFPDSTQRNDVALEDDIYQQLSLIFSRPSFRAEIFRAKQFLELLSLVNFETHRLGLHSAMEETAAQAIVPSLNSGLLLNGHEPIEEKTPSRNSSLSDNSRGPKSPPNEPQVTFIPSLQQMHSPRPNAPLSPTSANSNNNTPNNNNNNPSNNNNNEGNDGNQFSKLSLV